MGLLPPQVNTLEQQVERVYRGFCASWIRLAQLLFTRLQERAETLFYALPERHLEEMMPIIYTLTVGQAAAVQLSVRIRVGCHFRRSTSTALPRWFATSRGTMCG